jgi:hypothetical protein
MRRRVEKRRSDSERKVGGEGGEGGRGEKGEGRRRRTGRSDGGREEEI